MEFQALFNLSELIQRDILHLGGKILWETFSKDYIIKNIWEKQ